MVQTFTVNGREMTLERAQDYYASQKKTMGAHQEATQAPPVVVETKEVVHVIPDTKDASKKELRKECDEKGIKYHFLTGTKKLTALLQEFNINNTK